MKLAQFAAYSVWIIPLLFAAIHFIEMSAMMARISGVSSKQGLLAYSIQQSIYIFTRVFMLVLLPLLGILVDSQIDNDLMKNTIIASMVGASITTILVFASWRRITSYYSSVIDNYAINRNLIKSFISGNASNKTIEFPSPRRLFEKKELSVKMVIYSSIVYAIYTTGIFVAFFSAHQFPEYRTTISHMSGMLNAIAAFLLTFFIEPRISYAIDKAEANAPSLVWSLLVGRLIGVSIFSHLIVIIAFYAVG